MRNTERTLSKDDSTREPVLYVAFELSERRWKLAFSDGEKLRFTAIDARDLSELKEAIRKAKLHFLMTDDIGVRSCYEAGRDGFWLHRYLLNCGILNIVVDSSSIEVNRRKRRAKTDRIDAGKLLNMLMRYYGGERRLWSVVNVPSAEDEDARNLSRDLEALNKERTMHRSRIRGLLVQEGVTVRNPSRKHFLEELDSLSCRDGRSLPPGLKARVVREYQRLRVVEEQMGMLRKERTERVKSQESTSLRKVAQLMTLYGIGQESSWKFVMEFFGWRNFRNRREVAALSGLTPTPYDSGGSQREQGISKEGNRRIRTLAIEISWAWLRFQPQSKLSGWFRQRFADGGSRMRRIGIVAMARKLLIDLWRYLEHGLIPEGARVRPAI
jgi:transposase